MSYDNMDHAGWVERNIVAAKGMYSNNSFAKRRAIERKGWLAAPKKLNAFQRRAFTILGVIGGGIYNAPIEWDSVRWDERFIGLNWRNDLSTYDFMNLTTAVFLAHDAGIRFAISPKMRWLELHFHQRTRHEEGMRTCRGHPTLEQAIDAHRLRFPHRHHIHLEAEPPAKEESPPASTGTGAST